MQYSRAEITAMPDLPGSTDTFKLKVEEEDKKVWLSLTTHRILRVELMHVVIEEFKNGKWSTSRRYRV